MSCFLSLAWWLESRPLAIILEDGWMVQGMTYQAEPLSGRPGALQKSAEALVADSTVFSVETG